MEVALRGAKIAVAEQPVGRFYAARSGRGGVAVVVEAIAFDPGPLERLAPFAISALRAERIALALDALHPVYPARR